MAMQMQEREEEHDLHREHSLSSPGIANYSCYHRDANQQHGLVLMLTVRKDRKPHIAIFTFQLHAERQLGLPTSASCSGNIRECLNGVYSNRIICMVNMAARLLSRRLLVSLRGRPAASQCLAELTPKAASSPAGSACSSHSLQNAPGLLAGTWMQLSTHLLFCR